MSREKAQGVGITQDTYNFTVSLGSTSDPSLDHDLTLPPQAPQSLSRTLPFRLTPSPLERVLTAAGGAKGGISISSAEKDNRNLNGNNEKFELGLADPVTRSQRRRENIPQFAADSDCVTFLDTPGHAEFAHMRANGAWAADVVLLCVAADEGVSAQTLESIELARKHNARLVVAITKCDSSAADPGRVRSQLAQQAGLELTRVSPRAGLAALPALLPLKVRRSAKGFGSASSRIDSGAWLLEVAAHDASHFGVGGLRRALRHVCAGLNKAADAAAPPTGVVLEATVEAGGRGVVASVLLLEGLLEKGQSFVCGHLKGKVKGLWLDKRVELRRACPGIVAQVVGCEAVPCTGDEFFVASPTRVKKITSLRMREMQLEQRDELFPPRLSSRAEPQTLLTAPSRTPTPPLALAPRGGPEATPRHISAQAAAAQTPGPVPSRAGPFAGSAPDALGKFVPAPVPQGLTPQALQRWKLQQRAQRDAHRARAAATLAAQLEAAAHPARAPQLPDPHAGSRSAPTLRMLGRLGGLGGFAKAGPGASRREAVHSINSSGSLHAPVPLPASQGTSQQLLVSHRVESQRVLAELSDLDDDDFAHAAAFQAGLAEAGSKDGSEMVSSNDLEEGSEERGAETGSSVEDDEFAGDLSTHPHHPANGALTGGPRVTSVVSGYEGFVRELNALSAGDTTPPASPLNPVDVVSVEPPFEPAQARASSDAPTDLPARLGADGRAEQQEGVIDGAGGARVAADERAQYFAQLAALGFPAPHVALHSSATTLHGDPPALPETPAEKRSRKKRERRLRARLGHGDACGVILKTNTGGSLRMFMDAIEKLNASYLESTGRENLLKVENGAVGVVTFKDIQVATDPELGRVIYGFRLKPANPKVTLYAQENNVRVFNFAHFEDLLAALQARADAVATRGMNEKGGEEGRDEEREQEQDEAEEEGPGSGMWRSTDPTGPREPFIESQQRPSNNAQNRGRPSTTAKLSSL